MSMRELTNAHTGYIKERKEDWAIYRKLVHPMVAVHLGKKANRLKLDDILKIDFDDRPRVIKLATVTRHDN